LDIDRRVAVAILIESHERGKIIHDLILFLIPLDGVTILVNSGNATSSSFINLSILGSFLWSHCVVPDIDHHVSVTIHRLEAGHIVRNAILNFIPQHRRYAFLDTLCWRVCTAPRSSHSREARREATKAQEYIRLSAPS